MDRNTEILVARLEERMVALQTSVLEFRAETKVSHSELKSSMMALESRERERNGQIRELSAYRGLNEQHWAEHMAWASERADTLSEVEADVKEAQAQAAKQEVISETRQAIYKRWWVILATGVSLGATLVGILEKIGVLR